MTERCFEVHSDCVSSCSSVEMFKAVKTGDLDFETTADTKELINGTILDAPKILPFAAERYNISSDIKDYIISVVPIFHTNLPNRNNVAFTYDQLTLFNTDSGMLAYKTWTGKPLFKEHNNKDFTIANGIIFDSVLRRAPQYKGNLWKVILLCAWDRTRDPIMANKILNGQEPFWSMGCWCSDYRCSICGASLKSGGCEHLTKNDPRFKLYNGKLACWNVEDFLGFECSKVHSPAFVCAETPKENLIVM